LWRCQGRLSIGIRDNDSYDFGKESADYPTRRAAAQRGIVFHDKSVGSGTGLGLDITYRIIRQYNATNEV
jgi:hypothetical protein